MKIVKTLSNFQQRLLIGLSTTACIVIITAYSQRPALKPLFLIMLVCIQALALWEFFIICKKKGLEALSRTAIAASSAYFCARYLSIEYPNFEHAPVIVLLLSSVICFGRLFRRQNMAIATLAITCFGFCYVSFPLSLLLDINYIKDPITQMTTPVWIFFLMTVTKMTDVWAYICGKKLGTTPFMASISPKKTRAGAIGGFLGATIGGMLFYPYLPSHMHISLLELMLLSMIVGIASAFGDLAESLLKRDANVKDSSSIPGLGGVLDICDSTLFTAPVLYMYLLSKALI